MTAPHLLSFEVALVAALLAEGFDLESVAIFESPKVDTAAVLMGVWAERRNSLSPRE